MNAIKCFNVLFVMLMLTSCYHEVTLDNYRGEDGENLLTLNSLINPESSMSVSATRTYFFSDVHNERSYVKDLNLELWLNNAFTEKMIYNSQTNLYESNIKPAIGDLVSLRTTYLNKEVICSDKVPKGVRIESVTVDRSR